MSMGIHHVALRVDDLNRAIAFYTEGLGLKVRVTWPGAALLQADDGSHLELFDGGEHLESVRNGYYHLAYRVENVTDAMNRAVEYGAKLTMPVKQVKLDTLPIECAFVEGPSGESIEFFKEL